MELNAISEAALRRLIEAKVPESKTIDYKSELPGNADAAKKDFLADLCSFANALGGHLVFGMQETDGVATNLVGLCDDIDQAVLRLENIARDGVRPPIPGLAFVRVRLSTGNTAIVVHIPKSWNPPHQVIFQKDYRFYTRGSAGKQHLDVDELRRVVLFSQELGDRIRQFRARRVATIIAGDTPIELPPCPKQILHFVPFAAFGATNAVDLHPVFANRALLVRSMNRDGSVRHGGAVAQQLAHTRPAAVSKLTLGCTYACNVSTPRERIETGVFLGLLRVLSPATVAKLLLWASKPKSGGARGLTTEQAAWLQSILAANRAQAMRGAFRGLITFDSRPWLNEIRMPTLVVGGTHDVGVPQHHFDTLVAGIPEAVGRLVDHAGHALVWTHTRELADLICEQ
jgi:Putative DNA-binding domain